MNCVSLKPSIDTLIIVQENEMPPNYQCIHIEQESKIQGLLDRDLARYIIVVSRHDEFTAVEFARDVQSIFDQNTNPEFTLIVPYKSPPVFSFREDGLVRSFIISTKYINLNRILMGFQKLERLVFDTVYLYLISISSIGIEIVQIGKPFKTHIDYESTIEKLKKSLIIIPHKGSLKLLKRCLAHLNVATYLPDVINVCFDDNGYKHFNLKSYKNCREHLNVYRNEPLNVGPYLARHYSIAQTDKDYVFFQDSDDISVKSRFSRQLQELTTAELDMVGSHELRIDQIKKIVCVIRFPTNANKLLQTNHYHSLFHPTALISKSGYLKTGGFSTDMRFGYDTQFLLRAFFFLKIGNVDDFLYIRFKRPYSLTTHPKTMIGSNLRSFLLWRWIVDYRLILENKLDLNDSSLRVNSHNFAYNLKRI